MKILWSLLHLIICSSTGLYATVIQICFTGFVLNHGGPYSIEQIEDRHGSTILSWPLFNDLLLLLGFGLQHSAMPRGPVKKFLRYLVSEDYYQPFYIFASASYIFLLMHCWIPIPVFLWDVQQKYVLFLLNGLRLLSLLGLVVSLIFLNPLSLLGLRDPIYKLFGWKDKKVQLVTSGVYQFVRHPTYSFLMLFMWITPQMSVGHLLFSTVFTTYILFAVAYYEESDLVRIFGPEYIDYMQNTPRYIPTFKKSKTV